MKVLKSGYIILPSQKAWLSLKDNHAPENDPWTVLTKINLLAFWNEVAPNFKC